MIPELTEREQRQAQLHRQSRGQRVLQRFPVIECFGNTTQGEGADAGRTVAFVRLGGCDYQKCSWCDTPEAVEPARVRAESTRMGVDEIIAALKAAAAPAELAPYIVLSGGNPALHNLAPLVEALQREDRKVSIETQGSRWKPWLGRLDRLIVSPKPPSSGMATPAHEVETREFMSQAEASGASHLMAVKIVIFDEADYEWALDFHRKFSFPPLYLSAGTDQEPTWSTPQLRESICERFRWLAEKVAIDPRAHRTIVLPQLHCLAWGAMRGV